MRSTGRHQHKGRSAPFEPIETSQPVSTPIIEDGFYTYRTSEALTDEASSKVRDGSYTYRTPPCSASQPCTQGHLYTYRTPAALTDEASSKGRDGFYTYRTPPCSASQPCTQGRLYTYRTHPIVPGSAGSRIASPRPTRWWRRSSAPSTQPSQQHQTPPRAGFGVSGMAFFGALP